MRWNGFARSVIFAAAAAAALPGFALLTAPLLGASSAHGLYLVLVAAVYVAGLGPRRARSAGAALLALGLGTALLLLTRDPGQLAIGAALLVGVCRSAVLYRARPLRALVLEACLLGGGLALARFLAAPGALGPPLALWGFLLVQSAFFLVGGIGERRSEAGGLDPFDLALRRASALLDDA